MRAKASVSLILILALISSARAETRLFYAPTDHLERIDAALIGRASRSIDMAAYTLTDVAIIDALAERARRGVTIRLLLDAGQLYDRPGSRPNMALQALEATPGVTIRLKPKKRPPMHLKAYHIDGKWLRTGSANFTASGLKHQDNDLLIIDDPSLVAKFEAKFETLWRANSGR
jgi:phosphatidylserine/phosphatidylglycerophosphate/cardiolipin synthase-like enzyme